MQNWHRAALVLILLFTGADITQDIIQLLDITQLLHAETKIDYLGKSSKLLCKSALFGWFSLFVYVCMYVGSFGYFQNVKITNKLDQQLYYNDWNLLLTVNLKIFPIY